jgi:hypothetical protein
LRLGAELSKFLCAKPEHTQQVYEPVPGRAARNVQNDAQDDFGYSGEMALECLIRCVGKNRASKPLSRSNLTDDAMSALKTAVPS